MQTNDWRIDYAICEHLAADPKARPSKLRSSAQDPALAWRACCATCNAAGYMDAPRLEVEEREGLLRVGRIPAGLDVSSRSLKP